MTRRKGGLPVRAAAGTRQGGQAQAAYTEDFGGRVPPRLQCVAGIVLSRRKAAKVDDPESFGGLQAPNWKSFGF